MPYLIYWLVFLRFPTVLLCINKVYIITFLSQMDLFLWIWLLIETCHQRRPHSSFTVTWLISCFKRCNGILWKGFWLKSYGWWPWTVKFSMQCRAAITCNAGLPMRSFTCHVEDNAKRNRQKKSNCTKGGSLDGAFNATHYLLNRWISPAITLICMSLTIFTVQMYNALW